MIEEQLKKLKGLRKADRFKPVIERFKSMRNYLKYFGVAEEDDNGGSGTMVFDFGLVLENQFAYYSGLVFKLTVSNSQPDHDLITENHQPRF